MKFLTVNGKIQVRNGKPITVPDNYDNSLIKIGNNLVKTSTGLIGKYVTPGLYNANDQLLKSWSQLVSEGLVTVTSGTLSSVDGSLEGKMVLPESVTSIGNYAFANCYTLLIISLPKHITDIGMCAFSECRALTSIINFPETITEIKESTFFRCYSFTNFTIPKNVNSIGEDAFNDCENLENVNIPESVTSIEKNAFRNCTSLTNISLPKNVISIGEYAFTECIALTSITIPETVNSIGSGVFRNDMQLRDIYYTGTKEKWNAINKGSGWDNDMGYNAYTIHCTDGDITKS